jgi:hypothetical protein
MTPHPPLTLPTRLFLFEGKLFFKVKVNLRKGRGYGKKKSKSNLSYLASFLFQSQSLYGNWKLNFIFETI